MKLQLGKHFKINSDTVTIISFTWREDSTLEQNFPKLVFSHGIKMDNLNLRSVFNPHEFNILQILWRLNLLPIGLIVLK